MPRIARKSLIQPPRLLLVVPNFHMHSGPAQLLESAPADFRIRIRHRRDHTMNPGLDQRIRTRSRPPLVRVRLEIDVKGSPARLRSGLLESQNFGVLHTSVGVSSATNSLTAGIRDQRADIGV